MTPGGYRGRTAAGLMLAAGGLAVLVGLLLLAGLSPDGGDNNTVAAPASTATSVPREMPRKDDHGPPVSVAPARDPFLQVVTGPDEPTTITQSTIVPNPEPDAGNAPAQVAPAEEPASAPHAPTKASTEPSAPVLDEEAPRRSDDRSGGATPAPHSEKSISDLTVTTSGHSIAGQTVVLTARLSAVPTATGTPRGTVAFRNGSTVLGSAPVVAGAAIYATSGLAVGPNVLLATYEGDTSFAPSTSAAVVHMVSPSTKAPSRAVLTVAPKLARFGQPVVLTATVSPAAPSVVMPTGTVTFRDGNTVLASARLVGGTATYATPGLAVGPHVLVVTYEGDAAFSPSTSAPAAQVVGPARATTSSTKAAGVGPIAPAFLRRPSPPA